MPGFLIAAVVITGLVIVTLASTYHQRGANGEVGFFALPSTTLGRVSAVVCLMALVLLVLMSTLLEQVTPTVGMLNVGPAIGVLVLFGALVTGAVALIRDRERSWAVWLSTVLPAIVLGAELLSLMLPGE